MVLWGTEQLQKKKTLSELGTFKCYFQLYFLISLEKTPGAAHPTESI